MFCVNYYIGSISYYKRELERIPNARYGTHGSRRVLREYYGNGKEYREITPNSKNWSYLANIADYRDYVCREITRLKNDLYQTHKLRYDSVADRYVENNAIHHKFDHRFWEALSDEAPTYPKNNNYYHKTLQFRSRAELFIAKILDDLGLVYRYDVMIRAHGRKYFVDFVVYLPQFDCCFLIEYLGGLSDEGYIQDNLSKLGDYWREGIWEGEDLLVFCGDDRHLPPESSVREQIKAMINSISERHIVKK